MDAELAALNLYDILLPCYHGNGHRGGSTAAGFGLNTEMYNYEDSTRNVKAATGPFAGITVGRAWPLRAHVTLGRVPTWKELAGVSVPCIDASVASAWLNDPKVRKAIQGKRAEAIGSWEICTDRIRYFHDIESMIHIHKELVARGVRALIYSGGEK
jgi:serine carboxypeptidase-like clade I